MKSIHVFLSILLVAVLLSSCSLIGFGRNIKTITPSDTIITETRTVSGFDEINMSTIGQVTITQGDSESLVIKGADNVVPLVKTSVSNGVLTIRMDNNILVKSMGKEDVLTFTIIVKDLSGVTVSGLGAVEMGALSTKALKLVMSGAGAITFDKVNAENVNLNVSGLGRIAIAGTTAQVDVEISGAGDVEAAELECQTADVTISGLGSATVWVTGELTGNISGGGNVRYYGSPTTNTKTSGLGKFEAL